MPGSKNNKNPSWRSHEVAVATQKNIVILNLFQDLLKKDAETSSA
ncbi:MULTISPECIES: hypothetical protein [unclassified Rickettsia]